MEAKQSRDAAKRAKRASAIRRKVLKIKVTRVKAKPAKSERQG